MADNTVEAWRVKANTRRQRTFGVFTKAGALVDVTGWNVDAQIKTRPDGQTLHTFPDTAVTFADGRVVLTIPAAVSAAWEWTTGWYRVRVTNPDSPDDDPEVDRPLEGPFVVDPD